MSAQGIILGGHDALKGHFVAEGNDIEIRGQLIPPVPPFTVNTVTLKYENLGDLTGTYQLGSSPSHIGPEDLQFEAVNPDGKTISFTGSLSEPAPTRQTITGTINFLDI